MFRQDSKIGFRFGREEEGGEDSQPSPIRTALQASSADIARDTLLERTRQATTPTPPGQHAPAGTAAGLRQRQTDLRQTDQRQADQRQAEATAVVPVAADGTAPAPAILPAPPPTGESLPLIIQARAVIGQMPPEEEARMLDRVLRCIDDLAARQTSHDQDLRQARETAARAAADRARLEEENRQLRDLLASLMRTIEAERRRRAEAVTRIDDRLKALIPPPTDRAAEKSAA
ncbi:MAG: hypothetical protein RLY86_2993 [Pseudomonadota bacterium]|jgi:hypothetical protein